MSAITYPTTGRPRHARTAPSAVALRRRLATIRPRRNDDRPGVERNASLSDVTLRSIQGVPGIYR